MQKYGEYMNQQSIFMKKYSKSNTKVFPKIINRLNASYILLFAYNDVIPTPCMVGITSLRAACKR